MTDVVRSEEESAGAFSIVETDRANARRVTEQRFHQKRCRAIGERMEGVPHSIDDSPAFQGWESHCK